MKALVFALTALSLTTGVAAASTSNDAHQRASVVAAEPARTTQVPAGDVMTSRELTEAGLKASDLVTITLINTTEETANVDNSSHGFY